MAISVHTEITEAQTTSFRGYVLFDGECPFCQRSAARMSRIFGSRGFEFLPLQTPWVRGFFHLSEDKLLGEMRLLLRNGESFGGADAIVELAKYVWWGWPLVAVAQIPLVSRLLRAGYRHIAARRKCLNAACALQDEPNPKGMIAEAKGTQR
ncbi:MAG: DUF393 domain-containing protein [Candidatus Acidiferrales bacterium]